MRPVADNSQNNQSLPIKPFNLQSITSSSAKHPPNGYASRKGCYMTDRNLISLKTVAFYKPTPPLQKDSLRSQIHALVEKKKIKAINGSLQKASSEKPSRNSSRGSKQNYKIVNYFEIIGHNPQNKSRQGQGQEKENANPWNLRQPNLQSNLLQMLQKNSVQTSIKHKIQKGLTLHTISTFTSQRSLQPQTQRISTEVPESEKIKVHYLFAKMEVRSKAQYCICKYY